jgi:tetratricopeptide (TPR) repeat protein
MSATLPQANYLLGVIAISRARVDDGIALFRKELTINPLNAMAEYRLGESYARQQQWTAAISALQRSLWINPYFSGPYIVLGRAYLATNDPGTAEGFLRRAVEYDPNNKSAHYLLAQALQKQGHAEEAGKEFDLASKLTDAQQPR